jgi:hypothetical protein
MDAAGAPPDAAGGLPDAELAAADLGPAPLADLSAAAPEVAAHEMAGPDACPEVAVAVPSNDGPLSPPPDAGPPDRCRQACPLDCLNALTTDCAPAGNVVGGETNAHVHSIRYANGVLVEEGGPFANPASPAEWHFGVRVSKEGRLCYLIWTTNPADPRDLSYRSADGREVATGHLEGQQVTARCADELANITDTACPLLDGPPNCAPGPPPTPWCAPRRQ